MIAQIFYFVLGFLLQSLPILVTFLDLGNNGNTNSNSNVFTLEQWAGVAFIVVGIIIALLSIWLQANDSSWWLVIFTFLIGANWINLGTSMSQGKDKVSGEPVANKLVHGSAYAILVLGLFVLVTFSGRSKGGGKVNLREIDIDAKVDCMDNFGGLDTVRELAIILDVKIKGKKIDTIPLPKLRVSNVCDHIVFKLAETKKVPFSPTQESDVSKIISKINDNKLVKILSDKMRYNTTVIGKSSLSGPRRSSMSSSSLFSRK